MSRLLERASPQHVAYLEGPDGSTEVQNVNHPDIIPRHRHAGKGKVGPRRNLRVKEYFHLPDSILLPDQLPANGAICRPVFERFHSKKTWILRPDILEPRPPPPGRGCWTLQVSHENAL